MEGSHTPSTDAAPRLPPQAPPADAIHTLTAHLQDLADGEVTALETSYSTNTAASTEVNVPTEPTLNGSKKDASATAQAATQQNDAKAHSLESVIDILHELTTSVGINAELQCTLCHEVLCKPVSSPCGHSFCRVCLLEYLLSKELAETQCPICRGLVIHSSLGGDDNAAPLFSINVTLWNIIQLLVPTMREKDPAEEDDDYALKYDQFDAKWRIAALQQLGPQRPNRRRHPFEEIDSSDEEMMDGEHNDESNSEDGLDAETQGRRLRYPELREENTVDGHLEVFRNVVLDRDDANEDGYEAMRVSLAVMEFPSLFQPFNEHQECAIVVLKCEEDEDMDSGIPFFTSDDGDDDEFIMSDYYNEIQLRVTDDTGNVVMERTRGSTQGIATFPNLRLDVPAGMYDFQFKDDLYGITLTIRTEVRDLRDEDDNPELDAERPVGFVLDQAGERTRSRGRRRHGYDENEEEEEDDSESGSNDSFIVDDDEELVHGEDGEAQFSGDDESETDWSNPREDEEEVMDRRERSLRDEIRRNRERDGGGTPSSEDGHDDLGDSEAEADEVEFGLSRVEESESSDEGQLSSVSSGRSAMRSRIVDDDSDSGGDDFAGENQGKNTRSEPSSGQQGGRKRPRAIMESEDEEANEEHGHPNTILSGDRDETTDVDSTEPMRGFSSNKRLRQFTSRMFQDDDEEEYDGGRDTRRDSYGDDVEDEEHDTRQHRSRWVGSDPYVSRQRSQEIAENGADDEDGGNEQLVTTHNYSVDAGAHIDDDQERAHSEVDDEEEPWNNGHEIEHDGDEDEFSE